MPFAGEQREPDPELDELIFQAVSDHERALLSRGAAASTDPESPERRRAEQDLERSAEAWRKVVSRNEQLRMDIHGPKPGASEVRHEYLQGADRERAEMCDGPG